MKKVFSLLVGLTIIFSFVAVYAGVKLPVGTYQCSICGVIAKVTSPGTVLNETDLLSDGHRHDWHYIGGLGGTIHPIK